MPLYTKPDEGIPGEPLPLETQETPYWSAFGSNIAGAYERSYGITAAMAGVQSLAGGKKLTRLEAADKLKAAGYDPSNLPEDGLTEGGLKYFAQRQQSLREKEFDVSTSSMGGPGKFFSSVIGSLPDPAGLLLLPFTPASAPLRAATTMGRVGLGAAEGAAIATGFEAVYNPLARYVGDEYTMNDSLKNIAFGSLFGGVVHGAFGPRSPATGFDQNVTEVLKREGGLTTDIGGLANFGISSKAHPGVDVAKLTEEQAKQIYKTEYWDAIDGDNLPPEIAESAFDAAVNNGVGNAKKWLAESGGNPKIFNDLRRAEYERLAAENPDKYGQYLDGWLARVDRLEYMDTRGGDQQYFGSKEPIDDISAYRNDANLYGREGMYTTDAADVARTQMRGSERGVLYEAHEISPVKMYDAEQPLSKQEWLSTFDFKREGDATVLLRDATDALIKSGNKSPNLREVMNEIRSIAHVYGIPSKEVQKHLDELTSQIREKGYGGLEYQGGVRTNVPTHISKMYFNPREQLRLVPAKQRNYNPKEARISVEQHRQNAATAIAQAIQDDRVRVFSTPGQPEITIKPGRAFAGSGLSEAAVKAAQDKLPDPAAPSTDLPMTAAAAKSANEAVSELKKFMDDIGEDLDAASKSALEDLAVRVKETDELAKAVEGAIRCASLKGLD